MRVVPGGRYAERPARMFTPEELQLDVEMAELMDAVRGENGRHPNRGFQRATYGESKPWRVIARYIVSAARAGGDEDRILAITERLTRFAREAVKKHGRRRAA